MTQLVRREHTYVSSDLIPFRRSGVGVRFRVDVCRHELRIEVPEVVLVQPELLIHEGYGNSVNAAEMTHRGVSP